MGFIQETLRPERDKLFISENQELNRSITRLLDRKLGKPSVRSYFVYSMQQYIRYCAEMEGLSIRENNKKLIEKYLPFIIEAVMSVMYLHNQIFDEKEQVHDNDSISQNLIASNLLKDGVYDYIDDHFETEDAPLVQSYVRKMFRCVDVGQHFDKFDSYKTLLGGNHKSLTQDKSLADIISLAAIEPIISDLQKGAKKQKRAIRTYFERNYLISSALFRFSSELLMELMQYEGKERENIIQFSECYGLLMQLVNDNCDFILEAGTANKNPEDVLSDLKNEVITLPLLLHLKQGKNAKTGLVKAFFKTKEIALIKEKHNEILKEMIFSEALLEAMKAGREIAKRAKSFLNQQNEAFLELADLLSIAFNNRYYYHVYKAKKLYRKVQNKNKLYRCECGQIIENQSYLVINKSEIKETLDKSSANIELKPIREQKILA